jgi:hypothetical protein
MPRYKVGDMFIGTDKIRTLKVISVSKAINMRDVYTINVSNPYANLNYYTEDFESNIIDRNKNYYRFFREDSDIKCRK